MAAGFMRLSAIVGAPRSVRSSAGPGSVLPLALAGAASRVLGFYMVWFVWSVEGDM